MLASIRKRPKNAVLISQQIKYHEHQRFFASRPSFLSQISHFLYNNIAYPLHTSSLTSIFICCAWLSRLMRIALLFDSLLENISRERSTDAPIWKRLQLAGDPPLRFLNTETVPASHLHSHTNSWTRFLSVCFHCDCNSQASQLLCVHTLIMILMSVLLRFGSCNGRILGNYENISTRFESFNYEQITLFKWHLLSALCLS